MPSGIIVIHTVVLLSLDLAPAEGCGYRCASSYGIYHPLSPTLSSAAVFGNKDSSTTFGHSDDNLFSTPKQEDSSVSELITPAFENLSQACL